MERLGLDAWLKAEGLRRDGFNLVDGEQLIRINLEALAGRHVLGVRAQLSIRVARHPGRRTAVQRRAGLRRA
jgi:hypothetical protein